MDIISCLPDEILISILSHLSVREATRTSILSTRWKHLWKYIQVLEFDGSDTLSQIPYRQFETEKSRYINSINQVLESYRGTTIDFRACFVLLRSAQGSVDSWLEKIFAKTVVRLELDMNSIFVRYCSPRDFYTLPKELLFGKNMSTCSSNLSCLKHLSLKNLNVSGEVIEYFLSQSPLETLCVVGSPHLTSLRICGSRLPLKYLTISNCLELQSLEVSAGNLLFFEYFALKVDIHIHDVPLLTEVSFTTMSSGGLSYAVSKLSCCLSQLKVLKLGGYRDDQDEHVNLTCNGVPGLPLLKRLVLDLDGRDDVCLLEFTQLIKAAPLLHELVLVVDWWDDGVRRKLQKIDKSPHENLRIVEIIGYSGGTSDTEFAIYLLQNAVNLEKITINTCSMQETELEFDHDVDMERRRFGRNRARKLEKFLPRGSQLVII